MNRTKFFLLPLVTAVSLSPLSGWSVVLTEPVGVYADFALSGTTSAARPELAGVILEDHISNFSLSGPGNILSGTIQNRVVRSDLDGTLDFYWRITLVEGNGDITAFRVSGFEDYTLDADWRIDGLGDQSPNIARYFGSDLGAVNFLFDDNPVSPGEQSTFFFLDTDATYYNRNGAFDLLCGPTGCLSEVYSTFAPAEVPLPASLWLFGSALLGLGMCKR